MILKIEERFDSKPIGTILEQTPVGGTEIIPDETELQFVVSKGPDLRTVNDLTNYNEKALNDTEKSSGFKIKIVGKENHDSIQKGNVIRQDPKPNAKVAPGSTIEVVISDGPKAKPTKFYTKTITIPYTQPNPNEEESEDEQQEEIEVQPQVVRIYIQDKTRSLAEPAEEFLLTETTQRQLKLEISEGQKAVYIVLG